MTTSHAMCSGTTDVSFRRSMTPSTMPEGVFWMTLFIHDITIFAW